MITRIVLNYFLGCLLFLVSARIYAQETYTAETEVNIPQLKKFHGVMFPIWHKAFPKKDVKSLRSYSEKVQNFAEDIYNVKLPGILRDKNEAWKNGIEKFKSSVEDYIKYSSLKDDEKLLKTTEELHSNYENLVRIIHPVTPEISEFHKILYVIYHHYLPDKDYDKIKSVSDDFLQKAKSIQDVALPKRFLDKAEKYNTLSSDLVNSVTVLVKLCRENKDEQIRDAVIKVHQNYQKLEGLFD